mmetsp:Transcript_31921/g.110349  ORF Transcript_31921/g.110349 Transcript_31921/m.110349 type:complete len:271 (-) Transcript_31921:1334-2146(-)
MVHARRRRRRLDERPPHGRVWHWVGRGGVQVAQARDPRRAAHLLLGVPAAPPSHDGRVPPSLGQTDGQRRPRAGLCELFSQIGGRSLRCKVFGKGKSPEKVHCPRLLPQHRIRRRRAPGRPPSRRRRRRPLPPRPGVKAPRLKHLSCRDILRRYERLADDRAADGVRDVRRDGGVVLIECLFPDDNFMRQHVPARQSNVVPDPMQSREPQGDAPLVRDVRVRRPVRVVVGGWRAAHRRVALPKRTAVGPQPSDEPRELVRVVVVLQSGIC